MVPAFQPEPLLYIHNHQPCLFPPFGFHSASNCFVCNFFSSSVGFNLCSCFFRLTLVFRFRFRRLWAVQFTAFVASFPLSDPRCFSFLSSASVLGSDYSASVLPFLLFPVPPRSCFPGARFRSRFLGFPFLSGLISHAFLPGSRTRLRCSFPFALPCFAPTAVSPALPLCFRFRAFPLLPLSFVRFRSVLTTQPSVFPFPSSRAPLSAVPTVLLSSSVRPVSTPSFRFRYSAHCISFLRSQARYTAAAPAPQPSPFRFPAAPLGFRFRF